MKALTAWLYRISFRLNNAETWALGVDPDNMGENQFFISSQGNANPGPVVRIHSWGGVGIGATTAQLNTAVTQQNTSLLVNGGTVINGNARVNGDTKLDG
jgi:hypothetical protein